MYSAHSVSCCVFLHWEALSGPAEDLADGHRKKNSGNETHAFVIEGHQEPTDHECPNVTLLHGGSNNHMTSCNSLVGVNKRWCATLICSYCCGVGTMHQILTCRDQTLSLHSSSHCLMLLYYPTTNILKQVSLSQQ